MKKYLTFLTAFIFCTGICMGAETAKTTEPVWPLAAAAFDVSHLPLQKQSSGLLLPLLLIEKIYGSSFHYERPDETQIALLRAERDARIAAINALQTLYKERDELFFSVLNTGEAQTKYRSVNTKIKEAEKKLQTISDPVSDKTTEEKESDDEKKTKITIWTAASSTSLAVADIDMSRPLVPQMEKAKISGLITGVIESVGPYMRVTCRLYLSPLTDYVAEVSEAGSWEMTDDIVQSLASQLLPVIYGAMPAHILVTIDPPDASAVMDGDPLVSGSVVPVFPGEHMFVFSKDGYYASTATYTLEPEKKYRISAALQKQNLRVISYGKSEQPDSVMFEGFNQPISVASFEIPLESTIGYAENEAGDNAWFIIPEITFAKIQETQHFSAVLNRHDINDVINKRRNVMYWSLGALYLFLPVSMYYNGTYDNMVAGYNAGKIIEVDEINRIASISTVTSIIGWGLGLNFAVQLVRYMITVNKLTPAVLQPDDYKMEITVQEEPLQNEVLAEEE